MALVKSCLPDAIFINLLRVTEIAGKRDDWSVSRIGRIPDYTSQFLYKIWLSPNLTQLMLSPLNYSILNVEVFVRFKLNPIEVNVLLLENILAWHHSLH